MALQQEQRQHDTRYHRDVYDLPEAERINHLILHCAKYVGRLAAIPNTSHMPGLTRTMTDAFIIVLSMSDACGSPLCDYTSLEGETINEATAVIQPRYEPMFGLLSVWLCQRLAVAVGHMAELRERYDHGIRDQFPDALTVQLEEIACCLLVAAKVLQFDLAAAVRARWAEVEQASIV